MKLQPWVATTELRGLLLAKLSLPERREGVNFTHSNFNRAYQLVDTKPSLPQRDAVAQFGFIDLDDTRIRRSYAVALESSSLAAQLSLRALAWLAMTGKWRLS